MPRLILCDSRNEEGKKEGSGKRDAAMSLNRDAGEGFY